jgi:glycosyltransferase involved in cell wall biosynthesis
MSPARRPWNTLDPYRRLGLVHIAIIGARSVPGRYGGWDTVATELSPRLVERGCAVTVYCQPRYAQEDRPQRYRGVELVYLRAARRQAFESTSHEVASLVHAMRRDYDALYVFGTRASAAYTPFLARHRPVFFNTDGHDWQRRKWGPLARRYLRWSEGVAVRRSPGRLIADSRAIASYFEKAYGVQPTFIPYGANVVENPDDAPLARYGLKPRDYFLVVCRIEPENNVDAIVDAFRGLDTNRKLVVVGGTNYRSALLERLKRTAPSSVRFLGGIYDPEVLSAIYYHSFAYVHGHEVGGTNPALLQAMGARCCVLAKDVVFNREVLEGTGLYWEGRDDLQERMAFVETAVDAVEVLRHDALARVREAYGWERVADRYCEYFKETLSGL